MQSIAHNVSSRAFMRLKRYIADIIGFVKQTPETSQNFGDFSENIGWQEGFGRQPMNHFKRPRYPTLYFIAVILHCSCGSAQYKEQRTPDSTVASSAPTADQTSDASVPETPTTASDAANSTIDSKSDDAAVLCPAPQPLSNEIVLFDDSFHQDWDATSYGGPSSRLVSDGGVCSGTAAFALEHVAQKYSGSVFYTTGKSILVSRVSMRLYVSAPGDYTLGINFAGQKPGSHNFLYPPGSNSTFIRTLQTGWQLVEGDVPDSFGGTVTGPLTAIILEMQSDSIMNQFRIDDVRVTPKR